LGKPDAGGVLEMINRAAAETAIKNIFAQYKSQITTASAGVMQALNDGKLYELFVLSEVVDDLSKRGCIVSFVGSSLKFKAGPGKIKNGDPHFEVYTPDRNKLWLFVDIEFETLGNSLIRVTDRSQRHEMDIVLVDDLADYPKFHQIWLAVECKAFKSFSKPLIRQALGARRELSYFRHAQKSKLTKSGARPPVLVSADPASEFWLAYIDPKGSYYAQSPAAFGIELRCLCP
jgi:hypothetical protein